MQRFLTVMMLGGVALAQMAMVVAAKSQVTDPHSALLSSSASVDNPALPSAPHGKSTVLGGEIRQVDLVRDEFWLKIFDQRPLKILFDERTQVYRDGKKIPLRDLSSPAAHASVQTVLDGTAVYALSIHLLSKSPDGDYQGRVLSYNSSTRELTVNSVMAREPIKLLVPANTPIARVGQPAFSSEQPGSSDLVRGRSSQLILIQARMVEAWSARSWYLPHQDLHLCSLEISPLLTCTPVCWSWSIHWMERATRYTVIRAA